MTMSMLCVLVSHQHSDVCTHVARTPQTRSAQSAQAVLDMLRIITAIILLGLGAYIFKRDTTVLVLVPIERMFKKVRG